MNGNVGQTFSECIFVSRDQFSSKADVNEIRCSAEHLCSVKEKSYGFVMWLRSWRIPLRASWDACGQTRTSVGTRWTRNRRQHETVQRGVSVFRVFMKLCSTAQTLQTILTHFQRKISEHYGFYPRSRTHAERSPRAVQGSAGCLYINYVNSVQTKMQENCNLISHAETVCEQVWLNSPGRERELRTNHHRHRHGSGRRRRLTEPQLNQWEREREQI